MRHTLSALAVLTLSASSTLLAGCGASPASSEDVAASEAAVTASSIASIALANVGKGACSKNSAGGSDYYTSCTGNGGEPEYWCSDFARWVWAQAGAEDTDQLSAAAGSFYTYGENHGTLHTSPAVGDAAVFGYQGSGYADHVAIVTKVSSDGTIETVSGDWAGDSGSEAHFSSTSRVVLNAPAYSHTVGSTPGIMGMKISGFISPVGATGGGSSSGGSSSGGGTSSAAGCYSDTLGREMPANACVQSKFDDAWYQCDNGSWVDRWTDPTACDGQYPL